MAASTSAATAEIQRSFVDIRAFGVGNPMNVAKAFVHLVESALVCEEGQGPPRMHMQDPNSNTRESATATSWLRDPTRLRDPTNRANQNVPRGLVLGVPIKLESEGDWCNKDHFQRWLICWGMFLPAPLLMSFRALHVVISSGGSLRWTYLQKTLASFLQAQVVDSAVNQRPVGPPIAWLRSMVRLMTVARRWGEQELATRVNTPRVIDHMASKTAWESLIDQVLGPFRELVTSVELLVAHASYDSVYALVVSPQFRDMMSMDGDVWRTRYAAAQEHAFGFVGGSVDIAVQTLILDIESAIDASAPALARLARACEGWGADHAEWTGFSMNQLRTC